jgi:hypothetical protein
MKPVWIVTRLQAIFAFDCHQILFLVRVLDAGMLSTLDAVRLAASRVAHHVARLI